MSSFTFVSGLCAIPDERVKAYFSKYGSRIIDYTVLRKCKTQPCCYSLIEFRSTHTANAVLRHRPHQIDAFRLFVKRLPRINNEAISEHCFPVTELLIPKNEKSDYDIPKIENHFKIFGAIQYVKLNPTADAILVKYVDYDSVDRFFESGSPAQRIFNARKVFSNDDQTLCYYPRICLAHTISTTKSELQVQPQVAAARMNPAQSKPQTVPKISKITSQKTGENQEVKVPVKSKSSSKKSSVAAGNANQVVNNSEIVSRDKKDAPTKPEPVSKISSVPPAKEKEIKKIEELTKVEMALSVAGTNGTTKTSVILSEENKSTSGDQSQLDYKTNLEKTKAELETCQATLHRKECDYLRLQEDYVSLKQQNEELKRLLDQKRTTKQKCPSCDENESLIIRLRISLDQLENKQKCVESLYADALIKQKKQCAINDDEHHSTMFHRKSISNRLVNYERYCQQITDSDSDSRRLSFPSHLCGIVPQQPLINRSTANRLHIQDD